MAQEFQCANCGKTGYGSSGEGPMSGSNPPSGWISKRTGIFSVRVYCSDKCKREWEAAH